LQVILAKTAGFCFGVNRAVNLVYSMLDEGKRVCTLGPLIHNPQVIADFESRGGRIVESPSQALPDETLVIRTHGVSETVEREIESLGLNYCDATCPFVKKIHRIVSEKPSADSVVLIAGNAEHPEVQGILSNFQGEKLVFAEPDELESYLVNQTPHKNVILVAQTTFNTEKWKNSQKILKKHYTKFKIFDTICSVTNLRQEEALDLSSKNDTCIIVGGKNSSNTQKLFELCKTNCEKSIWIRTAKDLTNYDFSNSNHIAIIAGASTPDNEIQEVYKTMSEKEMDFERLLEETEMKELNTGDVVTGTVTHVDDNELQLDIGARVTGYIKAEQATKETGKKLTELFKKGDVFDAFVISCSDIDGVAMLSKIRADQDKNWIDILKSCENKTVLNGEVTHAVKGGVEVFYNGCRVFVPASQCSTDKNFDINTLVGKTVGFKVIETKPGKKAIGSISAVEREERKAKEAAFWAEIENGKEYHGTVRSLKTYGAFVDLGGVDGMVHVSDLSWKHIRNAGEVVKVGDEIDVFVKSFDAENRRISLGYKKDEDNPWTLFKAQYAVGDIVSVKIASMMPFGAFAKITDDVDGLIHISEIAKEKIAKPADLLSVGQVVDARIIAIDDEQKRVSLSIRSLIEEAEAAQEAMQEVPAEEVAEAPAENTEA